MPDKPGINLLSLKLIKPLRFLENVPPSILHCCVPEVVGSDDLLVDEGPKGLLESGKGHSRCSHPGWLQLVQKPLVQPWRCGCPALCPWLSTSRLGSRMLQGGFPVETGQEHVPQGSPFLPPQLGANMGLGKCQQRAVCQALGRVQCPGSGCFGIDQEEMKLWKDLAAGLCWLCTDPASEGLCRRLLCPA